MGGHQGQRAEGVDVGPDVDAEAGCVDRMPPTTPRLVGVMVATASELLISRTVDWDVETPPECRRAAAEHEHRLGPVPVRDTVHRLQGIGGEYAAINSAIDALIQPRHGRRVMTGWTSESAQEAGVYLEPGRAGFG